MEILKGGIEKTKNHSNYCLNFLLAYNGSTDILEGVRTVIRKTKGDEEKLTPELFRKSIMTSALPDVDLLIRTGVQGDPHNSVGFLMWQTQNSQYYFSDKLFPDFDAKEFELAIKEFAQRARRMGK